MGDHPFVWIPKAYGIPLEDILSRKRTKRISKARKHLAFEFSEIGFSYEEIAKLLRRSKRDIYYLVKTHKRTLFL